MAVKYSNNASTTLSASITNAATSLSVASGAGALFPALSGSDYFYVTVLDAAGNIEIMKVTARSADTFTVTRGQDGTSAIAWAAGNRVELRITKAMLDDFKTDATAGYLPVSGGTVTGSITLSNGMPFSFTSLGSGTYNIGAFYLNSSLMSLEAPLASDSSSAARIPLYFTWRGGYADKGGLKLTGGSNGELGGNVILHAGNYTDYAAAAGHTHSYLPLAGGTLTGKVYAGSSDGDSIEVRNDTASSASSGYITFKNKNGSGVYRPAARISGVNVDNAYDGDFLIETYSGGVAYKGLRVDENSNVLFYDTSGNVKFQWDAVNSRALINSNVVLHAGNYSSYALPLSGGTITGGLVLDGGTSNQANDATLYITAANGNDWGIRIGKGSTDYGLVAEMGSGAAYGLRVLFGGNERFRIGDSSQVISGNQILHAGNYSSYALPLSGGSLTTGASSNIFIGRNSTATNYNAISLNGNSADSSNMGLTGGGVGDSTLYINSPGSINVRTNSFGKNFWFSTNGEFSASAKVISGGNNGFANDIWYASVRNPIWSFGNASSYGISYYQGAAGIGNADAIGFSLNGTTSVTSNNFAIGVTDSYVNNSIILHAGNYTNYTGQYVLKSGDTMTGNLKLSGAALVNNSWGSSSANATSRLVPKGAAGSWDGSPVGAIKIRLPIRGNDTMWRMTVKLYHYDSNTISEYHIGNYSYSTGGYNAAASFVGSGNASPKNVRLGNDGSYDCVWIGETDTTWSYPVVAVTDFTGGFRNADNSAWGNSWDVSIVTSFGTIGATINPYVNLSTSSKVAGSEILHAGNYTNYVLTPWYTQNLSDQYSAAVNTAGWYTIATHSGARGYAEFFVYDNDSSRHNFVKLGVVFSFGSGGITVLASGRHGTSTIRHARLLYNTSDQTYGGAKLQIYCDNPSWYIITRMGNDERFSGWDSWGIITPVLENSPSGWAEYTRVEAINDQGVIGGTRMRIGSTDALIGGYQALHAGNYSSYALPLSGGTVTGTTRIGNLSIGYGTYLNSIRPTGDTNLNLDTPSGATYATNLFIGSNQVLHAGNYTSYSPSYSSGGEITGQWHFYSNLGGYCGSLSGPGLQAYSTGNNSAFLSFHKGGYYAVNMGLDVDNVLRIGGWSASANRWQLDMAGNNYVAGNFYANDSSLVLHAGNYSSYALPLSGGTLTGTLKINTSGSSSASSHFIIKRSGAAEPSSFGSYAGSWRSSIEVWNNDSTKMLFLNPAETDFNYAHIKSVNGGLVLDVGSSGGTRAIQIETSGVANFPQGLQQGGNTVLHAGNYTNYTPVKVAGTAGYAHAGTGMYPFYNWGGANGGASAPSDSSYTIGISVGSHPSDPNYGFQIARNMWNTGLWTRGYDYGWGGWVRLLDSSNYSSYALPASSYLYNIPARDDGINIDSSYGNKFWSTVVSTETTRGTKPGNYYFYANLGGGPTYGLQFASYYGGGGADTFYLRRGSDNGSSTNGANVWQPWREIVHSGNYSNYALPLTGGTVSGFTTFSGGITTSGAGSYFGNADFSLAGGPSLTHTNSTTPSANTTSVAAYHNYVGKTPSGLTHTVVRRTPKWTALTGGTFGTTSGILVDEIFVGNAVNAYTQLQQDTWSFYSSYSGSMARHFIAGGASIGPGSSSFDNWLSAGTSSARYTVVYAVTGSINTSDINEKEQIQDLDAAELRVATAIKGLIKRFKWKDAVVKKGADARIHVGVIAQEVEQAFITEGLDPAKYALFCKDVWWEFVGENGIAETSDVEVEGGVRKERKGIRYDQLLAFVIAAI